MLDKFVITENLFGIRMSSDKRVATLFITFYTDSVIITDQLKTAFAPFYHSKSMLSKQTFIIKFLSTTRKYSILTL